MEKSFEMLSSFPQTFTGDFSPPGSFTALLIADDIDDDFLPYDLPDQKPFFLPPPPETLESLIPPSVLSGYLADKTQCFPSFPHSSRTPSFLSKELNPRKRALERIPECSYLLESQQVQIPMIRSPDEFPLAKVIPTQNVPRVGSQAPFSQPASPTLESILNGFSLSEFVAALLAQPENDEGAQVRSSRADKGKNKSQMQAEKNRRRRFTEKVRCLGKLLPGEQNMSTATILEEAYSYIKFLQAQIQALSSMPARSAYSGVATATSFPSGVGGLLGSLSRQQLLEVVVNSPEAQTVLSSDKCCVVSAEQVARIRNMLKQRLSAVGI